MTIIVPSPADRAAQWEFVINSLVGGLDDAGILQWLNQFGGNLDLMVAEAAKVRDGMIAT